MSADNLTEKRLQFCILQYLNSLKAQRSASGLDSEGLDVANQCLSDVFELPADSAALSLPPNVSLVQVFAQGLQSLGSAASASPSPAPAPTPSDPLFEKYLATIEERGFFKDVTKGSKEYADKLEQARQKYVQRYGVKPQAAPAAAAAPSPSPSPAPSPAPASPSEADLAKAEEFKAQANSLVAKNQVAEGIAAYDKAIALNPSNAVYYSNRAAAHIMLFRYNEAVADCTKATELDSKYFKAWYRLGKAYEGLGEDTKAIDAYQKALKLVQGSDVNMAAEIQQQIRNLQSPAPAGGMGGLGGMDFSQLAGLMNNPQIASLMSDPKIQQMAQSFAGGAGGAGGLDFASLMNNPALMQMANQFMGGGAARPSAPAAAPAAPAPSPAPAQPSPSPAAAGAQGAAGSEAFAQMANHPAVQALRNDPAMAPILADVEANGPSAMFKYMNDPAVMSKLSSLMGAFGGPAGGAPFG